VTPTAEDSLPNILAADAAAAAAAPADAAPAAAAPTHAAQPAAANPAREIGGREGPEPTRFGDWELRGRCIDF
jgi:hypothetical protein